MFQEHSSQRKDGAPGLAEEKGALREQEGSFSPELSRSGGGKNLREVLLDAAEDLIVERGAAGVSLDKVAARAGVSKGGLLYHFPSKNALAQALIQRMVESMHAVRDAERGEKALDAELIIRTHISWWNRVDPKRRRLYTSLLAATAHDPQLVAPFALEYRKELQAYEDAGIASGRVAVIMMALHGLWLLELLGITLGTENHDCFMQELFRLAETPGDKHSLKKA